MIGYLAHSPHIGNRQNDSAPRQGMIDIGNAATTKNGNNYSNTKFPPKSLPKIRYATPVWKRVWAFFSHPEKDASPFNHPCDEVSPNTSLETLFYKQPSGP